MKKNKKPIKLWVFNSLLALIAFIIQYNGVFSIKIGNANPVLPFCIIIPVSMFAGEYASVLFALAVGVLADGVTATPICFNTIVFMLLAFAISLTVHYLFNNNIRSAIALGILGSFAYLFIRFIFCFSGESFAASVSYLLTYALPSVIYSTVFVVPIYFLEKHWFGKYNVR